MFLQSAYTGTAVAEYARPFDTVYVSLYKYFNAVSGAILAGPRPLLDDMYHTRRMFGAGLSGVWPFAAVALHHVPGFVDRFRDAVAVSESFIGQLTRHGAFSVERMLGGRISSVSTSLPPTWRRSVRGFEIRAWTSAGCRRTAASS